jgi:hypothetical protein
MPALFGIISYVIFSSFHLQGDDIYSLGHGEIDVVQVDWAKLVDAYIQALEVV